MAVDSARDGEPPCGATDYISGSSYEEPVEFTCSRPVGHPAPHRDRSPAGEHYGATAYEWWPESWWTDVD